MSDLKTVIGLEIHVQLKTKSKMFCGCGNNAEDAQPNTLVCPVCLGLPGALPVANRQAIEWTVLAGLALNCQIAKTSKFDRKHYFYPDLPKGYQISQYDQPFCIGGNLEIISGEETKKINFRRIHLEEDAGKLIHIGDASLVDLNRAGTPLMEIVTEPEISSPGEAKILLQELRSIMRYLDISDADMEKGHLRCDANISISQKLKAESQKEEEWIEGIPTEIKNINSFRMLERALTFEEKRQKEVLETGGEIVKETRGWNDSKGETYSQRSKEQAQDYRYFPEPDLPPFEVEKIFNLDEMKNKLPELPAEKRKKYIEMGLKAEDAAILVLDKQISAYFEKIAQSVDVKLAANWIINELKLDGILIIAPENMVELLEKLQSGEITGKMAKDILVEMINSGKSAADIITEKGYKSVGDKDEIAKIVDKVIAENTKSVTDYRSGKTEALGYLIGQVMRESHGSANPQIVNEIIKEKLS